MKKVIKTLLYLFILLMTVSFSGAVLTSCEPKCCDGTEENKDKCNPCPPTDDKSIEVNLDGVDTVVAGSNLTVLADIKGFTGPVRIDLFNGVDSKVLVPSSPNAESYVVLIPLDQAAGSSYTIRVINIGDEEVWGESEVFTISAVYVDDHESCEVSPTTVILDASGDATTDVSIRDIYDVDGLAIDVSSDSVLSIKSVCEIDTYATLFDSSGDVLDEDDNSGLEYPNFSISVSVEAGRYCADIIAYEPGDCSIAISVTPDPVVFVNEVTNLTWQYDGDVTRDWNGAGTYCVGLELGGYSDWRLPTDNELVSLYFLNGEDVSGVVGEHYWTSTETWGARAVLFDSGSSESKDKSEYHSVRCVRSE